MMTGSGFNRFLEGFELAILEFLDLFLFLQGDAEDEHDEEELW